jgi:hypothetical protein
VIEKQLYALEVDLIGRKVVAKENRDIVYREKSKRVTDQPTYYDARKNRGPSKKCKCKD